MSFVTILWSGASAAALLLALVYGVAWAFDRRRQAHLALSVAALSIVGVAITELGMMYAQTPAEWNRWVYWGHVPMFFMFVSLAAFVRSHFNAGRAWLLWAIVATRSFVLVGDLVSDTNFNFESVSSLRRIPFLGEQVSVLDSGVTSSWQWIATLSVLLLMIFVADASWTLWRRNEPTTRRRAWTVGGGILLFTLSSAGFTQLVIWGQLQMPALIAVPYLFVVVAMALEMGWDTLRTATLLSSLKQTENRLELAANAAQLGLWTRDMRQARVWATDRARSLFGLSSDDSINIEDLRSRINPEDYPRLHAALKQSLRDGSPYYAEFRVNRPDSEQGWIAAHGGVETDGDGRITSVHGVLRDVSEHKKAQAEADALRREVSHSGRITMLGRLSSALAHELSQPLGAILRNSEAAEMLLAHANPNLDELRAIVSDIHKDDQRAGAIIDRLRSLLKRRQLQFLPLSVDSLVQDVNTLVRADATARQVALLCRAERSLPMISGDRVHLSQVLINLILNGIDSVCDSGESRREVTVAAHALSNSSVEITVSDSGPGISAESLPKLFQPFFTTKTEGMGMGLSVSRTIVEAHGGRLCAENQNKGGAVFRVVLPAMQVAA